MPYDFVQAKWFTPGAIREYRAIVFHMAEGGGTVSYLKNVTRDVSASHVIEYSGRIVQMVKDGDASHCQHTSPEPYLSANFGTYSSSIGRAVLGDGWADVNRYVFAVEIEGFRENGPNAAQQIAMAQLVTDLRHRFPTIRGLLGHRDIQDKACPGGKLPWASIGGHGLFPSPNAGEDEMNPVRDIPPAICDVAPGGTVYGNDAKTTVLIPVWSGGTGVGIYATGGALVPIRIDLIGAGGDDLRIGWVGADKVSNIRARSDNTPYTQAQLDAARAAGVLAGRAESTTRIQTATDEITASLAKLRG